MARKLLRARWIAPVATDPIGDGELLVENGRIVALGPRGTLVSAIGDEVVDFGDAAILPGLVNTHSHLELTVMRGLLEDLEFRDWIVRLMTVRTSVLTSDDMLDSARIGTAEALASGVTTTADTCDTGVALEAMIEAGIRGIVFQEVFGPDVAQAPESMRGLDEKIIGLERRAAGATRIRIGISPHAPYTVSAELFRRATAFAIDRSLPMAIHAAESDAEEQFVRSGRGPFADGLARRGIAWTPPGTSTIAYLDTLGVLEARPLLIHATRATGADLDRIAATGSRIAHCPKSNAKLGHGSAPLSEMRERRISVGLGTDSVASNNVCDLLDEARAALMIARARLGSLRALSAREALRLATLGGAEALGLENDVGSLEEGKRADLCVVTLDGWHARPVHDVESALVYSASARDVVATFVDGERLYDARRRRPFSTLDSERLRARCDEIRERIASAK